MVVGDKAPGVVVSQGPCLGFCAGEMIVLIYFSQRSLCSIEWEVGVEQRVKSGRRPVRRPSQ